jgi:hypothetical protein
MIFRFLKLWNHYGWYFIFFGSIFLLFLFYFFNLNKTTNKSITLQSIFRQVFDTPEKISSPKKKINNSKGEQKCKEFLEFIFQKPFIKIRPPFLINPITNAPLELDCYNEELKLAIEYNGKQHYEYNKMMHQNSKSNFQNQQYRDYIKQELCKKHGIELVIVPYSIHENKIPDYLYTELKKRNYSFSVNKK